jgi:hypothetical protein
MAEQQYQQKDTAEILDFVARGITVEKVAQSKVEHEQFCEEYGLDPNNSDWYASLGEALTILNQQ